MRCASQSILADKNDPGKINNRGASRRHPVIEMEVTENSVPLQGFTVAVIGASIGGLSCARALLDLGASVKVLEKYPRGALLYSLDGSGHISPMHRCEHVSEECIGP